MNVFADIIFLSWVSACLCLYVNFCLSLFICLCLLFVFSSFYLSSCLRLHILGVVAALRSLAFCAVVSVRSAVFAKIRQYFVVCLFIISCVLFLNFRWAGHRSLVCLSEYTILSCRHAAPYSEINIYIESLGLLQTRST